MITNSRDKDLLPTKQESTNGAAGDNHKPPAVTSSRLWPGLRDPRIVRVSRAFGGKDRHSKVSTVRGLRDRRVRLSVPTAIQLYDLQDRLGVNQPSKVVDWLLSAAHLEIDKLPPLQIPQSLSQCHEAAALSRNPSRPPVAENFEHANEHWEAAANAYLSQFGTRPSQAEAPPALAVPDSQMLLCPQGPSSSSSSMFPSYFSGSAEFDAKQYFVQTQIANWAQSNSAKSSPHFGGTPVRHFP